MPMHACTWFSNTHKNMCERALYPTTQMQQCTHGHNTESFQRKRKNQFNCDLKYSTCLLSFIFSPISVFSFQGSKTISLGNVFGWFVLIAFYVVSDFTFDPWTLNLCSVFFLKCFISSCFPMLWRRWQWENFSFRLGASAGPRGRRRWSVFAGGQVCSQGNGRWDGSTPFHSAPCGIFSGSWQGLRRGSWTEFWRQWTRSCSETVGGMSSFETHHFDLGVILELCALKGHGLSVSLDGLSGRKVHIATRC